MNAIRGLRSFSTVHPPQADGKDRVALSAAVIMCIRSFLFLGCRQVVVMTRPNLEEVLQAVLPARLQAAHLVGNR